MTTPPGWKELYRRWIDGGWNALSGPVDHGGQGLPIMLGTAALEMWNSGAMAFGIGPTLTMGAVEAIDKHGTDALKSTYLPKLVSGEWMGTMNLTEPQAGSDLNALKSRAEPAGDGSYRIFGTKIFITYGEHDFTDNIVHLVLARLPDAPPGTRGLSLFLVPKFLVNADGSLGARNDVFCGGIEHKLGIHGSPTCTMIYGDGFVKDARAGRGRLADRRGEPRPRLHVHDDEQCPPCRRHPGRGGRRGRDPEGDRLRATSAGRARRRRYAGDGMAPIVHHPDVKRDLLTMTGADPASRARSATRWPMPSTWRMRAKAMRRATGRTAPIC